MNSLQAVFYEENNNPCPELFPKKLKYNPTQFDAFYDFCLQNPASIFVITTTNLLNDIPQSIPCIVFDSPSIISNSRLSYNTLFANSNLTKKQIRDLLDTIPKNIVSYPITQKRPDVFWQYPVITEKYTLEKIASLTLENIIYVGIPYATLIDKKLTPIKEIASIALHIQQLKKQNPSYKIITACQHIHYPKLLDIFTLFQIDDLYISHKQSTINKLSKINLHGLPLYPVNIFDHTRQSGLQKYSQRKYLFSFIGAYMKHYLHPIRKHILEWKSSNNYFIEDTNIWHFEKDVYQHQVLGKPVAQEYIEKSLEQQNKYNEILSNSEFSLCPIGAGPNTIRLWESICIGSIPIIIADEFDIRETLPDSLKNLKFYIQLSYSSKHLKSPNHLEQYLKTIAKEDINIMRINCAKVTEHLHKNFIAF